MLIFDVHAKYVHSRIFLSQMFLKIFKPCGRILSINKIV